MKLESKIDIDSKRYPKALKTAKKLKSISSFDILNDDEVIFLGYLSVCVALEAFINYMLYIFAKEQGNNKINSRFEKLISLIKSTNYSEPHMPENKESFGLDKKEIIELLSDFFIKYFKNDANGVRLYNKRNNVIHGNLNYIRLKKEVSSEEEHKDLLAQHENISAIDEFYNYGLSKEVFHEMFNDCDRLIFEVHSFFKKYINCSTIKLVDDFKALDYEQDKLGRVNALNMYIKFPYDHEHVSWSSGASVIK